MANNEIVTVYIPDVDPMELLTEGRTDNEITNALAAIYPQVLGASRRREGNELHFERQVGGTKGRR